MSAEAIFTVTQALRARLELALVDANDHQGKVFVGPLDDPSAKGASLILFLYRIAPNPSLRNRDHVVLAPDPNEILTYRNALPLVLHYLITVGSRDGTDEDPLLRVLGYALRRLNDDPELSGIKVGHEIVQVSLEPLSTEEMSRIWTLFPTANYRTSVAYLATPVWIDPKDPPAIAGRVVEDRLNAGARSREPEHA